MASEARVIVTNRDGSVSVWDISGKTEEQVQAFIETVLKPLGHVVTERPA